MHDKTFLGMILTSLLAMVVVSAAIAADDRHISVSSDGVMEIAPLVDGQGVARSAGQGVAGSNGRRDAGVPLDALAEFPASRDSVGEMAALANTYHPLVPSYVRSEAETETVIGIDSRYRISPSASGHPERAIGLLTFNQGGGSAICTGWLINANTVVTAGHCVHQGSGGAFSTNVRFFPGRDGAASPFGSCTARTLFTVTGWSVNGNENFDYGAVKLNCNIGTTTGFFGFFWQSASLVGLPVQVSGYPGDKPFGTHWSTSGDIAISEASKTRYKHDSFGGQSGGPVFQTDRVGSGCTGPCVNTIHAYGVFNGNNSGTRINQSVFNNLINWRNAP